MNFKYKKTEYTLEYEQKLKKEITKALQDKKIAKIIKADHHCGLIIEMEDGSVFSIDSDLFWDVSWLTFEYVGVAANRQT